MKYLKIIGLCLFVLMISCGDTTQSSQPLEQQSSAVLADPYAIAIIQLSNTSNATKSATDFGTFPNDLIRISHGKTTAQFVFYGPYHATPTAIGCNGDANHDGPLLINKAMTMAQTAGVPFSFFKHIWFDNNADLQPACFVGGASGGNSGSPSTLGFGTAPMTGFVTNHVVASNVAMHEFLHGFNGPGLNSHIGLASCLSGTIRYDNANCTFLTGTTGAPSGMWSLGGSTFGQTLTPAVFDVDPILKAQWNYGWLPAVNIYTIPTAVGTYTFTLYPSDGTDPLDASKKYAAILNLPDIAANGSVPPKHRAIWFEYRKKAPIGLSYENRPGTFVYYEESMTVLVNGVNTAYPTSNFLKIGSNDTTNYAGMHPLRTGYAVVSGENNVIVKAISNTSPDTQTVTINIFGSLL